MLGVESGDAWRTESLSEMAACFGVDAAALEQTVADYNTAVLFGSDPLGRATQHMRHRIIRPPFWGCYAGLSIHTTMGGLAIDENARCLDRQGRPVSGLFAAGECASGQFFEKEYPCSGSMLSISTTYGRVAGQGAAAVALDILKSKGQDTGNEANKPGDQRGFNITEGSLREGLKNTVWPGRFQILRRDPLVILDGAHNPNGTGELADCLEKYFPDRKFVFVCGVMADKDYLKMLPKN